MKFVEAVSTADRSAIFEISDLAVSATSRLLTSDVPVQFGVFAAGICLILAIPTLGHRFRAGPRSSYRRNRRLWSDPLPMRPRKTRSSAAILTFPFRKLNPSSPFTGRARVVDGDTVVIRGVRVRLRGIDAPELDQPGGVAARAHLSMLTSGRPVTAVPIEVDIHGRTVARIEVAGTDLCSAMVADGFAIAYRRFSTAYVAEERAARAGRLGLWAECAFTGIESPAVHRYRARVLSGNN